MKNESIWIAKGFVVSSDPRILVPEFLNKTDKALLEFIPPIVKNLEIQGILERWFSSRCPPRKKIPKSRARIYIKTAKINKEAVLKTIINASGNIEIVDEVISEKTDSNSDIKQMSSEIALKLLPQAIELNRSEEFLKIVYATVKSNEKIQNVDGIHWLENNLGFKTGFLIKRFLSVTEIF